MMKLGILAIALAACASNSSGPTKGSSAKGAGQKVGGTAHGDTSMATNDGASYESITCDDSEEGVAWCDDDHTIVFCSSGIWWSLDCADVGGDFCAETDDTVDCYSISD